MMSGPDVLGLDDLYEEFSDTELADLDLDENPATYVDNVPDARPTRPRLHVARETIGVLQTLVITAPLVRLGQSGRLDGTHHNRMLASFACCLISNVIIFTH